MRLGLIGLGRIGAYHAETLTSLPAVDSLVVTDAVPAAIAAVADRLAAEPADNPERLLAAGIDGLLIAAATPAHASLLRAGVDAGIPTFCEKPLSGDVSEAAAIAEHVRRSGVAVQIGYPRRYDPAFVAAREAVLAGELGWVHTVRSTTLDPAPPPREYLAVSGGLFRDCSVHDFDTVRWITGREPVEVYAAGSTRGVEGADFFAEIDDVATATVLVTFDDGATAVITNTRFNPRGMTSGSSCTAPRTASPPAGPIAPRCATSSPAPRGPAARRSTSSWTGSGRRSAPSWRRSPTSSPEHGPRRARSTTRWR